MKCDKCEYASKIEPSRCTKLVITHDGPRHISNENYSRKCSDVRWCVRWRFSEKEVAAS